MQPDSNQNLVDISVVIPAYNASETLERCLSYLEAQVTSLSFEVIVVDSSPIASAETIVARYPFARLIRSPARLYPGAARNIGLEAVRGRFTFFLDAHNFVLPNWLEKTHHYLNFGQYDIIGGSRTISSTASMAQKAQYFVEFMDFLPDISSCDASFVPAGNSAMRSLAKGECGFPAELRAAEDLVFFLHMHQKGARIGFIPDLCVEYIPKKNLIECLRHLRLLGYWSGKARSLYQLPGKRGPLFNYLLPLAVPYRFTKLTRNILKAHSISKIDFIASLPFVFIYLVTWTLGQIQGTWSSSKA